MILNIKRLFGILDRWKWGYIASGLLLIASIFVRMLEPKIIQIAVDNVILYYQSGGTTSLTASDYWANLFLRLIPKLSLDNLYFVLLSLGALYMAIAVIRGIMMLIANAITASATEKAIRRLRDRLFSHLQALPLKFYSNQATGELIQRCTGDVDTVRKFMLNQVVDVIRLTAIFGFSFYMIYIIDPRFAWLSILLVPIIAIGGYIFFKMENKVWEAHEVESDRLTTMTQENLNGIRVVKAFAQESYEIRKFDDQNKRKLHMGLQHVKLHAIYWPLSDLMVYMQMSMSFVVGGYFAMKGWITIGELAAVYTYVIMVAWPLRQVGRILSQMGMAVVAIGRIYDILKQEEEDYSGNEITGKLHGKIVFDNVSFKYDEDNTEHVLCDVSFQINPGEKVAFIGPTGSGKSTIIKLLTRFYDPDSGEIYLDDVAISTLSRESLRKRIGVVLQKAFLFSTSIHNNIAYAEPASKRNAVIHAAEVAGIGHIEEVFPEGYDTVVGEKGVTLSGGQKQRVALARTILSEPDILILDDITSAVDTETEFAIFDALNERLEKTTTVIISHRLTSIQQADRIIVLNDGKIEMTGTHESLIRKEGYYLEINRLQSALESMIDEEISIKK
ncbi:MAG: ABC transporter ATP-binding protein [Chitinophagales bacterium]|nr:ABC transporter ATP-binding protein [Chitinophagales bacterium]